MPKYRHIITIAQENDQPAPQMKYYHAYPPVYKSTPSGVRVPAGTVVDTHTKQVLPDPVELKWPAVHISEREGGVIIREHDGQTYFSTGYYVSPPEARKFGQALIDFANQVPDYNEEN